MKIINRVSDLVGFCKNAKLEGKSIGLVPTMGALHNGHMSLAKRARAENDILVASVFVNPTQFNNPEDLRTYPRTAEADTALLAGAGADAVFMPEAAEIYPGPDTRVFDLGPVAQVMEGAMRPGHFNGVAQIVSKLFEWTKPTRAYFGEKDFQQIAVIRRMKDICGFADTQIVACPIVREDDGLAMSSRNVRLDAAQRQTAPLIYATLRTSLDYARDHSVEQTRDFVITELNAHPLLEVEYFSIVHPLTMQPVHSWGDAEKPVGCITVYCGPVRLIDNITYFQQPSSH